jgi:hypothetical protein
VKCILVGMGEVGSAVHEVFSPHHLIDTYDIRDERKPTGPYEVLLVAIPCRDQQEFVEVVNAYRTEWKVRCTIIFSTVAIGTTRRIPGAVHAPVEGKHPELARSMRLMPRWVGGKSDLARRFFLAARIEPKVVHKPEWTEYLKLRSTSKYGVNIEWTRYEAATAAALGMDFSLVKDFDRDYNRLYQNLGLPQYTRYILEPPKGNLGGHCILPNAKLLREAHPHPFLDEMLRDHEEGQK